jgi:CBS domain-containing protein
MGIFSGTKVEDVMTERPRAATPLTTAEEAAQAMATEDVGALPVVEDGKVVGIVTDRDLVVRVMAQGLEPATTPVGQIASGDPVTVRPGDDLENAVHLMAVHQVRRLAVVDESDVVVGVLAQADVARHAGERQVGQVLESISEPVERGPRV